MSYYTDFILKFPCGTLAWKPSPDNSPEINSDLACLEVIKILVPGLAPLPLFDTLWTAQQTITQEQVHALLHGLPWSRFDQVQLIFREEAHERYCDRPLTEISIQAAARGLVEYGGPETLTLLRGIQEPTVAMWLSRYVLPGPFLESDEPGDIPDELLHVFG